MAGHKKVYEHIYVQGRGRASVVYTSRERGEGVLLEVNAPNPGSRVKKNVELNIF